MTQKDTMEWAIYLKQTRPDLWDQYQQASNVLYESVTKQTDDFRRENKELRQQIEEFAELHYLLTDFVRSSKKLLRKRKP